MRGSKKILEAYEAITFPIQILGALWHIILEVPFHIGRTKTNGKLHKIRKEALREGREE